MNGILHGEQRVAQRHARVRERAGIQDQEIGRSGGERLHALDQLVLGIALEAFELSLARARPRPSGALDGGQRRLAIETGFPACRAG